MSLRSNADAMEGQGKHPVVGKHIALSIYRSRGKGGGYRKIKHIKGRKYFTTYFESKYEK